MKCRRPMQKTKFWRVVLALWFSHVSFQLNRSFYMFLFQFPRCFQLFCIFQDIYLPFVRIFCRTTVVKYGHESRKKTVKDSLHDHWCITTNPLLVALPTSRISIWIKFIQNTKILSPRILYEVKKSQNNTIFNFHNKLLI